MGYKRRIYCSLCDFFCYDIEDYVSHVEKKHPEMIPDDYTPWQYVYYLKTNKTHGNCVVCGKTTKWNESTHKYHRFCDDPKCKEKYRSMFKNRMIGKYGKVTLLNDPEQQKKMLANRKISGTYLWRDHHHTTTYTGQYEKSFLTFLDQVLNYDPEDVMAPSPHTYWYEYEGKKHFYIPDFFISSLNLEIEIKDGGDNPNMHHKIQDVDKVKEKLKDEVMTKNLSFDYIKIVNMDNMKFLDYLSKARDRFANNENKQIVMLENSNEIFDADLFVESDLDYDKSLLSNYRLDAIYNTHDEGHPVTFIWSDGDNEVGLISFDSANRNNGEKHIRKFKVTTIYNTKELKSNIIKYVQDWLKVNCE